MSELPPNISEQLRLYSDGCNSLEGSDSEEAWTEQGDVGIVSAPTSMVRVSGQGVGLTHGTPGAVVECEVKPG